MKILSTWTGFLLAALLAGCTSESEQNPDDPTGSGGTDNDGNRREVTLILKNDLVLRTGQTTKASEGAPQAGGVATKADTPIATTDENAISSLDVYVFGSTTENGEYTFQEKFVYRANAEGAGSLPPSASQLKLTAAAAGDTKETTGLLKLKKGLFVKLYCIANNTKLIGTDGNEVTEAAFVPIVFTQEGNAIQTEGQPKESVFTSYHTPLLSDTEPTDVLTMPLAMSGAYITPLDLTDFESSARMQVSFKLTRIAARFDIINNAETSKFTIESIAMGKARRAATFFPIRIYGDTPTAKDGELITCPARTFEGDNANLGIQTGAFYSYPSPKEDEGFLILKGTYQVNKTESKEVTYQVPFISSSAKGNNSYLEINNNNRYTLAITNADDYHLDFALNVDDWADNGSIDEYTPEIGTGNIAVSIPPSDTETQYNEDNHVVTMSLNPGTTFDMVMEKTSLILPAMTKTYAGGLSAQEYDWLEITAPVVTTSAIQAHQSSHIVTKADGDTTPDGYTYTFALKDGYAKSLYPRAIVRFTNLTNGKETVLLVDAIEALRGITTIQEGKNNHNTFDHDAREAGVYRLTDSNLRIKLFYSTGVELGDCPAWLTPKVLSKSSRELLYSFTLNDVNATPTDDKGTIVFKNTKHPDKTLEVTVKLLAPDITPVFDNLGGTNNTFTPEAGATKADVSMRVAENNTFKFTTTSLEGIQLAMDFDGGPAWLRHDGDKVVTTKAGTVPNAITFYLVKENLLGAKKATITLKNKTVGGGQDYIFTVTPDFTVPQLTSAASMTLDAKADGKIPAIEIAGNCFGGSSIVADESPSWLTFNATSTTANTFAYKVSLVPSKAGFPTTLPSKQTITLASNINPDKKTTVMVDFTDVAWIEEKLTNADETYSNSEYRVGTSGKTITLTAYSMFAMPITKIETAYDNNYGTNKSWLPTPSTPKTGYANNRKTFTYQIVIPASSGTDAAYQLHKGTITVKQNTTNKTFTIWRGASNVPYGSGRSDNPKYSAVKKGGIWWAPLNLGATQIATDGTTPAGTGKYYQWGRKVATTYGSTNKTTGPISNENATDEFITSTQAENWDWLKPKNDYLWRDASGKKTAKDPCPEGWRVPTGDELRKWGSGTWANAILTIAGENGINLVLPGAGDRLGGGDSTNRGKYGRYWSSSPSGAQSPIVYFDGRTANVGTSYRVNGFSVRCVKE